MPVWRAATATSRIASVVVRTSPADVVWRLPIQAAAAAQNSEVKALVEKSLPELQNHLVKAQALDRKLSAKKG